MIITKTPYRMSFFGGGTDYPSHYLQHGGQVISCSFNKYCYISCRRLPPFFEHKHRIVYSQVENVNRASEIKHPAVRAILSEFEDEHGLEIHHDGDLPARSGLGSSSSFVVGLLHALRAQKGQLSNKEFLAKEAIRIEQSVMKEHVGSQDQIAAAYGGFNNIQFFQDGSFRVNPVIAPKKTFETLNSNLLLFFTGLTRFASDIAKEQINNTNRNISNLNEMNGQVDEAIKILNGNERHLHDFGLLLNEAWKLKRGLSSQITNSLVDDVYEKAIKNGALGGKLLGAGGGGFIVFYADAEKHENIKKSLSELINIPFDFESGGSSIVSYEPE